MKNLFLLAALGLLLAACGNKSDAVEAEVGDKIEEVGTKVKQGVAYQVQPSQSQVLWTGGKVTGDKHTGSMTISEGRLAVAGDDLIGGEFTIDIASLNVTDLDENSGKGKLEGHLKSGDFFDAGKYPDAKFTVVQVQPVTGMADITHNITGNLTMKGVTKSVTIPANVIVTDAMISAVSPSFQIDRNDWNMSYGSGLAGAVGDNVINDEVELVINLKANRA